MRLSYALRLGLSPRLALVGSGGKTTALFLIARELIETSSRDISTVLVTATTHLGTDQLVLADHHRFIASPREIMDLPSSLPEGVVLLTGPQAEPERVAGLGLDLLDRMFDLADVRNLPLLVEADGSRRRPLKAPADHEPVIPPWVETVVVVVGLSGLGKPLTSDWVHRPERFAALSGLHLGEPITPQALAQVLTHPEGGLKGIPAQARRIVLLNQADSPERQALASRLSGQLLGHFHAVLVAALAPPGREGLELETSTSEPPVFAVHEPVAGVVLAAGASRRYGSSKQTLLWRGQPLVRHVATAALQAGLAPVVVVTGDSSDRVKQALNEMPLLFGNNSEWQAGQSTSLVLGLRLVPPETGAVVFLLADQPLVTPGLIGGLVELHAATLAPIVAPQVSGQRANPVLFDRLTFPELLTITGDIGGRALFSRYRPTWLPWHDPNLLLDVDTPEDYRKLLEI